MADIDMDDAPTAASQSGTGPFTNVLTEAELDEKYPDRPKNTKPTPPFHALYMDLFEPLLANKQRKVGVGGRGSKVLKPHEVRRQIIERFIAKWRAEVGMDIYPAFRLIMPDKDRDRTVYGLKEKNIGKIFVKVMKIDKNSDDGNAMINWKLPGQRSTGDFAGRCYEIIKKRPMRTKPGDMSIARVNELLDKLAGATKEEVQLPILTEFYNNMNPEELMWLVRIILKQMKVGATEKSFFDAWHPDSEHLFNVSSQLKRVCWELWDPTFRLGGEDLDINLMSCFQPQLAQFQKKALETVVKSMHLEDEPDAKFWIEEKLDGERMQLHYHNGAFRFWSRKAKDYTYLYGEDFNSGSLTQFLKKAFNPKVKSIILDGEMITWDPKLDTIVGFGTLKTAAIEQANNPANEECNRPLFKVFDILYLNGKCLTNNRLDERRRVLETVVSNVERRLEIHNKVEATTVEEIETELRQIVATGSEGLVIKNPRSLYKLNDRNDDWIKVKPEYMTEFGEELDCLVIGGYYGTGRRGGILSSYLCGLRVDGEFTPDGEPKFWSFFKVGGGFTASDYRHIQHITQDAWVKWDVTPPRGIIELATSGRREFEKPDVWIHPRRSFVVSVKAAQVSTSDQFKMGKTLRFPRFKEFKKDKDWSSALSITGFNDLKAEVDIDVEKKMDVERKKRTAKRRKKEVIILGQDEKVAEPYAGPKTSLFEGCSFYVMTESMTPPKKTVAEIEQLIKAHGGKTYKSVDAVPDILCIGDRNVVKVAALKKKSTHNILRPSYLFACIAHHEAEQSRGHPGGTLLPLEPSDLFFATPETAHLVENRIDQYGDSYTRDIDPSQLLALLEKIDDDDVDTRDSEFVKDELLEEYEQLFADLPGWMFRESCIYLDYARLAEKNKLTPSPDVEINEVEKLRSQAQLELAELLIRFGDGVVADDVRDGDVTQVVVGGDTSRVPALRGVLSERKRVPRVVAVEWVRECFDGGTVLDEARFPVSVGGAQAVGA